MFKILLPLVYSLCLCWNFAESKVLNFKCATGEYYPSFEITECQKYYSCSDGDDKDCTSGSLTDVCASSPKADCGYKSTCNINKKYPPLKLAAFIPPDESLSPYYARCYTDGTKATILTQYKCESEDGFETVFDRDEMKCVKGNCNKKKEKIIAEDCATSYMECIKDKYVTHVCPPTMRYLKSTGECSVPGTQCGGTTIPLTTTNDNKTSATIPPTTSNDIKTSTTIAPTTSSDIKTSTTTSRPRRTTRRLF